MTDMALLALIISRPNNASMCIAFTIKNPSCLFDNSFRAYNVICCAVNSVVFCHIYLMKLANSEVILFVEILLSENIGSVQLAV